jgi:hypothetical protein
MEKRIHTSKVSNKPQMSLRGVHMDEEAISNPIELHRNAIASLRTISVLGFARHDG